MKTLNEAIQVQGRLLTQQHIDQIRRLFEQHPSLPRSPISKMICEQWNWRDELGRTKDIACREMLVKLQSRGLIELPAPRRKGRGCTKRLHSVSCDDSPIESALADLVPIAIKDAGACPKTNRLFCHLVANYHYLGMRDVGRNMKYIALDPHERPLACLLFGSAAWKVAPRDRLLGWDQACRHEKLLTITNNTRFLILPWVRVANLASWLLSQATRRLSRDWQERYGTSLVLVETFVDRSRFEGTCYRAANWICVGQTQGRSRQDTSHKLQVPIKDVYLYPLQKELRKCLR